MLTPRQKEVAERVAKGWPNKRIARELDISPNTVARHIKDAAAKLPEHGRARHRLMVWFFSLQAE
jgi:DNA-binding NarL/FixJ family response regulator